MASISEAVFSFLSGQGAVGNRVYPRRVPDGVALPALAFQRIGTDREHIQQGQSSYRAARFQLGVVARHDSDLDTASKSLTSSLEGAKGTWAGVPIHGVHVDNDFDAPEPNDSDLYRRVIEFTVEYTEA